MFDCPRCGATGNQDGTITIVAHQPDCPELAAQVRRRWPLNPSTLPETPPAQPFTKGWGVGCADRG